MDLPATTGAAKPALKDYRVAVTAARQQGDAARALDLLDHAMAEYPAATWPPAEAIAVCRTTGQAARGYEIAQSALARAPRNPLVWLQLGLLHRARADHEAALTALEQAQTLDPANVDAMLALAQTHFTLGHQQRSDECLAEALAADTGIKALSHCAQRAMAAGDPAAALNLFTQAITRSPWLPPPYLGACTALSKLGRTGEAMDLLRAAIDSCGSKPALHARRAQLLRDMGFAREALADARAAATEHPDSFPLWDIVMRLLIMIGTEAEIAAWLDHAPARSASERSTAAALAGDAAAERGDTQAALDHYARAAELHPTATKPHGGMAVVCLTRFDIDGATTHLRRQVGMLAPALRLKSRSDDPAQSYYGQIINEYRLDEDAAAALSRLPADPAERAALLAPLCAAQPGSTLLAAALVDALARSGAFAQRRPPGGDSPIPLRVAQYWDSDPPPADVLGLMQSWQDANPDHEYTLFDDLRARAYLHAHFPHAVLRAYHRAPAPAMKADLFRLAWLAQSGGLYADADDRCTAPVTALLPPHATLMLYREYIGTLGNNVLAAAPGNPVIQTALDAATTAINRGDQDSIWLATGPGLITRAFAHTTAQTGTTLATTQIWQRRDILRHVSIHCTAGYKDTTQHWVKAAFSTAMAA